MNLLRSCKGNLTNNFFNNTRICQGISATSPSHPRTALFQVFLDAISEHVKMISLSVTPCWILTICSCLFFILGCSALSDQAQWPAQTSVKSQALRTSISGFTLQYVSMDLREEESPLYKPSSLNFRCFWYFRESYSEATRISLGACHLWILHFTLKCFFFSFFLSLKYLINVWSSVKASKWFDVCNPPGKRLSPLTSTCKIASISYCEKSFWVSVSLWVESTYPSGLALGSLIMSPGQTLLFEP